MTISKIPEQEHQAVFCSVCGGLLTSKRSIRLGMGQRCYRAIRGLDWPLRKAGHGPPIDDVPFTESGGKHYQRKQYEAMK